MYRVTKISHDDSGKVQSHVVGEYTDKKKAMTAAKKTAGARARFVKQGDMAAYMGKKATAWIT